MPLDFERIAEEALRELRAKKAKKSLPDLAALEQLLMDEEPEAPMIPVVEMEEVTFRDMLVGQVGGQDVVTASHGGDFAEFLKNDAKKRLAGARKIRKMRGGK